MIYDFKRADENGKLSNLLSADRENRFTSNISSEMKILKSACIVFIIKRTSGVAQPAFSILIFLKLMKRRLSDNKRNMWFLSEDNFSEKNSIFQHFLKFFYMFLVFVIFVQMFNII